MLTSTKNIASEGPALSKAISHVSQSTASQRGSTKSESSNHDQTATREEDKNTSTRFANSSNSADLKFSSRIWKSLGNQFGTNLGFGYGTSASPFLTNSSNSPNISSPSISSNNAWKSTPGVQSPQTQLRSTTASSACANGQCGNSNSDSSRLPGAVDHNIASNTQNDPLHTGATPHNFTIFSASNSRETAKATSSTGEYSNFLIHHGITREGKSLNDMLTSLNGQTVTSEMINAKLAGSSVMVQGGSRQTAHVTGAGLQQEFSTSRPAQNGRGIILVGEPEGTGSSMVTDIKKTQEWMRAIGIKDIDVVHSEAEFEAKIKEIRAASEASGQKHDLLAYSVISHGNVSDHNNNGKHNSEDQGYAYVDRGARYNEADIIGDMEHGALAAENTVALFHTCNSGCFDTKSAAKKEE